MGRPKLHKRDETVKKAMDFFWKNGFAASSVRELGDALDLRPGSLYASFGSKENLYLEALEAFAQESGRVWEESFTKKESFFPSLRYFLWEALKEQGGPCTCMLSKTMCSKNPADQALVVRSRELMSEFRDEIASRVQVAQERGEISKTVDPDEFARLVQIQILGWRTLADSGLEDSLLEESLDRVLGALQSSAS